MTSRPLSDWLAPMASSTLPTIAVGGVAEDSGAVASGDLFLACAESAELRERHIQEALDLGAAAILIDQQMTPPADCSVPVVAIRDLRSERGAVAARFYADPSASLRCIGITGTNGKTSTAFHIANLSDQLGVPCGYVGTLGWGSIERLESSSLTTPDAVSLQRRLAAMKTDRVERVALEVSSHSLHQGRAKDVKFDIGVFTNLTRDHLDYHKTMQAYGEAKAQLFNQWPLELAVINGDDAVGRELLARARAKEVISFGQRGDVRWRSTPTRRGTDVRFMTPWGRMEAILPVVADFAVANIAAALTVIMGLGHGVTEVADALATLRQVPGRMQAAPYAGRMPRIVVDYAHTPDAVAKALSSLRPQCRGRLICVVGCGGDRDPGKRPQMAHAAALGCDQLWLTSDNPRHEKPEDILRDMHEGLAAAQLSKCTTEPDREVAIRAAISGAHCDDVILIAGKGHEDTQEIEGSFRHFSDAEVVQKIIEDTA